MIETVLIVAAAWLSGVTVIAVVAGRRPYVRGPITRPAGPVGAELVIRHVHEVVVRHEHEHFHTVRHGGAVDVVVHAVDTRPAAARALPAARGQVVDGAVVAARRAVSR